MNVCTYFSSSGVPATGLAPTITAIRVSDSIVVVTNAAMTEMAHGWYKYDLTTAVGESYVFTCNAGTDTVDDRYPAGALDVPDDAQIAAAVLSAAVTTPITANIKQINDVSVSGTGVEGDTWGPA